MNDDDFENYGDIDTDGDVQSPRSAAIPPERISAGDGLPGFPVEGLPGLRAGLFGSGKGLLGLRRLSDLVARAEDDRPARLQFGMDSARAVDDPRLLRASGPGSSGAPSTRESGDSYPMPPAYRSNGHGGVQLKPGFASTHPKGPLDFGGMAKEIDWPGVALDLGSIAASSAPLVGGAAADLLKALPGWGIDTWRELHHDAQVQKGRRET